MRYMLSSYHRCPPEAEDWLCRFFVLVFCFFFFYVYQYKLALGAYESKCKLGYSSFTAEIQVWCAVVKYVTFVRENLCLTQSAFPMFTIAFLLEANYGIAVLLPKVRCQKIQEFFIAWYFKNAGRAYPVFPECWVVQGWLWNTHARLPLHVVLKKSGLLYNVLHLKHSSINY